MPRAVRNPENAIIQTLLRIKAATWADLLEDTKLSKGALSKYLTLLINSQRIKVNVDTSEDRRKTKYSLIQLQKEKVEKVRAAEKLVPIDIEMFCKQLIAFSSQSGYQISKLKDREQARILLKEYLIFNIDTIASYIPYFIELAFWFSVGVAKARKLKPGKQYDAFVKRLKENFVKKIFEPWIESLAFSAFQNRDISLEVKKDGVYPKYAIEIGKRIDLSFFDKMQEIQPKT